jgi:hypothetical protein
LQVPQIDFKKAKQKVTYKKKEGVPEGLNMEAVEMPASFCEVATRACDELCQVKTRFY